MALRGRETLHGRSLPSRKESVAMLRRLTGQDFGDDAGRWAAWLSTHRKGLYERGRPAGETGAVMTEAEWQGCVDPFRMLTWQEVNRKAGQRKFRLFACAVCRRWWPWVTDARSRHALEVAEAFADGKVSRQALQAAHVAAAGVEHIAGQVAWPGRRGVALATAKSAVEFACGEENKARERQEQAEVLRDLLGPLPFRPVAVEQSWIDWNGGIVVRLAVAAYENRRLPEGVLDKVALAVLADALEESGCDSEMLGYLRGPGPHWRGCWVVDLLTGRL
jgi:hypothetical protein